MFKKIFYAILLITFLIILSSCVEEGYKYVNEKVVTKYEIIEKEQKQEYSIGSSWFWDKPVYKTIYYLVLKKDDEVITEKVSQTDYHKYSVGDIYIKEKTIRKKVLE